jgi:succinoglycan biosynthesis transport protein ExoP
MKTLNEDHRLEIVPDLRREWMILVRRRWLIVAVTVAALVVSGAWAAFVRPVYESTAILSVSQTMPNQPLARLTLSAEKITNFVTLEKQQLNSREFAARVLDELEAAELQELSSGLVRPWYRRLRLLSAPPPHDLRADKARAVELLQSRLDVETRSGSTWFEIRVTGFDPVAVAGIGNALVRAYLKETAEANRQTIEASRTALDDQLDTREKKLGEELSGLRAMGAQTGVGDIEARKQVLERQIRGFQEALVTAQTARVGEAATRKEAVKLDASVVAADPRVVAAQARVTELEDLERSQLATLGSRHPDVVATHEQLEAARARHASAVQATEKAADSAYQLAVNEEARVQANLERLQKELAVLEKESFSYSMGARKAEASRLAFEQMIKQQENTGPLIVTAEVIQAATPADQPKSPRPLRDLLYALAGGLLAGLALSWGLDRFDDSIRSPDDVKDILGLPFLGVIPQVPKLALEGIRAGLSDTQSGFSDGLRVVRTNIVYGALQLKPKVLVFTSASPGDGKSTVASGIALLLHEAGGKVLLIDGDLRRPSLQDLFGPGAGPGLSELLAQEPPISLQTSPGPIPGFDLVLAGPPLTISAARLGSANMKSLLAQAREAYDWVIIDSPPSLGLPDSSVLATMADGVVIVCSGDKTPRQALRSVTDQLRSVGASVLGVVLNRVNLDRHSYYYGRYYSPYYGSETKAPPTRAAS